MKTKNKMNDKQEKFGMLSIWISLGIHLLFFVLFSLLFALFESDQVSSGNYVEVTTIRGNINEKEVLPEQENEVFNSFDPTEASENTDKQPNQPKRESINHGNIKTAGFDSTSLNQIYRESTLNVRLKYPVGWVYVDQQRKKKLDGITFWAAAGEYNPPPYIHVEVVEKYMFIPDQYKYKYDFKDFEGYYNDPVELENQVTQSIYLRTDDDEDFIIKLIMTGKDQFKEFQPVFFSMVNSFSFGNSLF